MSSGDSTFSLVISIWTLNNNSDMTHNNGTLETDNVIMSLDQFPILTTSSTCISDENPSLKAGVMDLQQDWVVLQESLEFLTQRYYDYTSLAASCGLNSDDVELDERFAKLDMETVVPRLLLNSHPPPISTSISEPNEAENSDQDGLELDENGDDMHVDLDTQDAGRDQVAFVSGYTDLSFGIVHLFRNIPSRTTSHKGAKEARLVLLLAVPTRISTRQLLDFVSSYSAYIQEYRILRDASTHTTTNSNGHQQWNNKYMVLMKFRHARRAREFVGEFDSKKFESGRAEVCHALLVGSVDITHPSNLRNVSCTVLPSSSGIGAVGRVEVPTCPVCLERMDASISGIVTVLCHHSFHCECLSQWTDSRCPVCRYTQQPKHESNSDESGQVKCSGCDSKSDLWVCLICGHAGCGRYQHGHAYQHYSQTGHLYALELETQRVWDYGGDGFVHRLIRNKADGKVVELPPHHHHQSSLVSGVGHSAGMEVDAEKDKLSIELGQLLSISLESQRQFFEQSLESTRQESLKHVQRERRLNSRIVHLESELAQERAISDSLRQAQGEWQQKCRELEGDVRDLKEQVGDLMAFLECRDRVDRMPDEQKREVQQGRLEIRPAASSGSSKTRRARRR